MLPAFDTASLKATLPTLTPLIAGSSAKGLRAAMAGLAAHIPLASLVDAGWLNKPPKNLLLTCRDVLLAHPDPAVGPCWRSCWPAASWMRPRPAACSSG